MVRPSAIDPPDIAERLWENFGGGYGWDIGANCGQTVLTMAQRFDKFTCFEPCQGSYDYLRGWYGGDVRQIAVSDHDGMVELALPDGEQAETGQLVTPGTPGMEWSPSDWSKVRKVMVPCRTADSLARELGAPSFLKVDTEGHEVKILQGASGLLSAGHADWLVEFHSLANWELCTGLLCAAGYLVETIRHPGYPKNSHMWAQHGWLRAFSPHPRVIRPDN